MGNSMVNNSIDMYDIKTFDKKEDMYKSYEVAKLLNPTMSEDSYKSVIDRITSTSNYKQHVVMHDDKVVSMIATQDVLMMGNAPKMTCKLDNVATLPEYRGYVTSMLMNRVIDTIKKQDYGGVCLDCSKRNEKGTSFYTRMGFEPTNNGWVMKINSDDRQKEL